MKTEKKELKVKLKTEELIKKFKEIHGDKYNYSKFIYKNYNKKSIFICYKHGEFEQIPNMHKNGSGCPKCAHSLTQKTIINQFKKVHGDKYDYSLVNYTGGDKNIEIICKKHGKFTQHPRNHKKGSECPFCSEKQLSETDVINQFKKVHGNKYDYSLVKYINNITKVNIICSIHGLFEQTPQSHRKGSCCPKCKIKKINKIKKEIEFIDKEEFMKIKFREIHGDKYNYSKMEYKRIDKKIIIICPEHGEFEQTPLIHKKGFGCSKCSGVNVSQEDIINNFIKVHGNRYDYSKVKYKRTTEKVTIICKEHGEFQQLARNHKKGNGCPFCAKRKTTTKLILDKFKIVHGNKYDYSKVKFIESREKVSIICKKHGEFKQNISIHSYGHGCPKCNDTTGFKKTIPGILYYIRIEKDGYIAYKIGITNRNIKDRFENDIKYITVIREWYFDDGEECYNQEQKILKEFSFAKWNKNNLLNSGNSEMFDRDILLLDN